MSSEVGTIEDEAALPAGDDQSRAEAVAHSLYQALVSNAFIRATAPAYRIKRRGIWLSWTWADAEREVARIHSMLSTLGVRFGEFVAISGEANPRLYWYLLAVQRAGAVPVLLHSRMSSAEFAQAYEQAGFAIFVAGTETQVDAALGARDTCPGLRVILALDRGLEADTCGGLVRQEKEFSVDIPLSRPSLGVEGRGVALTGYDAAGNVGLFLWPNSAIRNAAAQLSAATGLTARDQLVTFLPVTWWGDFVQFSAALFEGALISSVEDAKTVLQDLRRVAPDILIAPVAFYRKLFARIEGDIRQSPRLVNWLHAASKAKGATVERGFRDTALDLVFRWPLKEVTGLSKLRLAVCAEAPLPAELRDFFSALDVPVQSVALDPAQGRLLVARKDGGDLLDVETTTGAHLSTISRLTSLGNSTETPAILGRRGRFDHIVGLENVDLDDCNADELDAISRHAERLAAEMPVKHVVFGLRESDGWIAIIDPDVDYLRTISPDPGAEYRDLISQEIVLRSFDRAINFSNGMEARYLIAGFSFFGRPLEPGFGVTRFGKLAAAQLRSLWPTSIGSESANVIKLPVREIASA